MATQGFCRGHSVRSALTGSCLAALREGIDPHQRDRHRQVLAGEVPSPLDLPSGCCFRTRCPYATDRCAAERPALRPVGDRLVACHRAEELQLGG